VINIVLYRHCMHGLIEIHTGSTIIGNVYN